MRVRDHLALGAVGAALVSPWTPRGAIRLWVGLVLIDADHYLWFCVRERRVSPVAAVRFFHRPHAPQHAGTRVLHRPGALLAAFALALARPRVRALAAGMALHVALDVYHEGRMSRARAAALRRDDLSCRRCGARGSVVGTHLERQPWLLPDYGSENLVSLCGPCHEQAHLGGVGLWS
jgi:hypothetical protein